MSDGCEMYGELLLDSLPARRLNMTGRGRQRGWLWVGVTLLVVASAPLLLGRFIAKAPSARAAASQPNNHALSGVAQLAAPTRLAPESAKIAHRTRVVS